MPTGSEITPNAAATEASGSARAMKCEREGVTNRSAGYLTHSRFSNESDLCWSSSRFLPPKQNRLG